MEARLTIRLRVFAVRHRLPRDSLESGRPPFPVELFTALISRDAGVATPVPVVTNRQLPGPARLNGVNDSRIPWTGFVTALARKRLTRFERQRPLS